MPWRNRPSDTWSNVTSTTSFGFNGTPIAERSVDQRLGSPGASHQRQKEILESAGEHDNDKVPDSKIQKVPKTRRVEAMKQGGRKTDLSGRKGRQGEFLVSRGGMNQESRQHNKA